MIQELDVWETVGVLSTAFPFAPVGGAVGL